MKLIYVAGKYSADTYSGIDDNIRIAEKASIELMILGWAVICPHKNTAHYEQYEVGGLFNYEFWIEMDVEILKRCDAMFILNGSEDSKGVQREILEAHQKYIPTYYEKDGYPKP